MIENYININRLLRAVAARCEDAIDACRANSDGFAQATIGEYIKRDVRDLLRLWPRDLDNGFAIRIADRLQNQNYELNAFQDIHDNLLPRAEDAVDDYFRSRPTGDLSTALLDLLHPAVFESSYEQYRAGRYRDAVFNSIVAVFDLIRAKTGLDKDGIQLIGEVFSLDNPKLIFSDLETDSGRNDQKGFLQILQGAYVGIRNPKAHSLITDLDQEKAVQYLVFASLLARRVDEAKPPPGADSA